MGAQVFLGGILVYLMKCDVLPEAVVLIMNVIKKTISQPPKYYFVL